jgi:RHS repeat-associated protein
MPASTQSKVLISRRLRSRLLAAASSAIVALPGTAFAQMVPVPAPPVEQSVDANGVDVVFGTFNISSTDLSIGPAGAQGMVYERESRGAGWRDNLAATISTSGTTVIVSIGGSSDSFTQSGSTFTSTQGNGATLVLAGDYIYTSADGTVVRFAPASGDFDRFVANMGWARSIEFANGARWDFTYTDKLYCPQVLAGGQTCTVPLKRSVRLQSVANSFRYQLKLEYGANTLTHMGELEAWNRLAKVTGINNAVEACAPAADSCALTNPWPFVTYDASGETVTHSAGTVKRFTKGTNGITAIKRPGSATDTVTVAYGADGRVSQVVNEGVVWNYAWADLGNSRTLMAIGPLGAARTTVSNLATSLVQSSTDGLVRTNSFEYDAQTRLTRRTAPEGNYTQYGYDNRGNLTTTTNVAKPGTGLPNIITSATYPATCSNPKLCNKPLTTTDALGRVTNYSYDPNHGGITTVTAPAATAGSVRPQTRYSYTVLNGVSLLTATSTCQTLSTCAGTADEVLTVIGYGAATSNLLPISASTGAGNGALTALVSAAYDIFGNRVSVDGPLAGTADMVRTRYDGLQRVVGVVGPDPDGAGPLRHRAQRITYNGDSQPVFTESGTVVSQSDADWPAFVSLQQTESQYDGSGRLFRAHTTASGTIFGVVDFSYDGLGRSSCVTQRLNPAAWLVVTTACTAQATGSAGPDRISRTLYDEAGQVVQVQSAVGTGVQQNVFQSFTLNGNVASLTDGKGNVTRYAYDGFDRRWLTRFPSPDVVGETSVTDYEIVTRDVNGNIVQLRKRDGKLISFGIDHLDRVTFKNLVGDAPDVYYTYDLLGRLTNMNRPADGVNHNFIYDALSRLLREEQVFGSTAYQYDLGGRRTRLTWNDGAYVTYENDVTGATTAIRESGAALLATYAYDDLGRRTSLTRGNGTVTSYAYDPASRLSSLTHDFAGTAHDVTSSFTYNAASQIASRTRSNDLFAWNGALVVDRPYTSNGLNQHSLSGVTTLGYDGRGNLTNSGGVTYAYTSENLMKSAPGTLLFYDAAQRLVEYDTDVSTRFVYDGDQMAAEVSNPAGTVLRRYVHGPGTDAPILWYEGAGLTDKRYLHADERGSIIAVSNASGQVTQINAYDDYGIPQGKTSSGALFAGGAATSNFGRFGYTGQAWLPEIGMSYYKNRVYSPTLGRFIQPDPIGYEDGVNLYAYVGGDPINFSDPLGFRKDPVADLRLMKLIDSVSSDMPDEGPLITVTGDRCKVFRCGGPEVTFTNSGGRGNGNGGNESSGGGDMPKPPCEGSNSFAGQLAKRADNTAKVADSAAIAAAGVALITSPTGIVGAVSGGAAAGAKVGSVLASVGAVGAKFIDGNVRGALASAVDGFVGPAVSRLALSGARRIAGSVGPASFNIGKISISNSKAESFLAETVGTFIGNSESIGEAIFCRK